VPEGNYKVSVTLGNPATASTTTIKAELRRLMVENVSVAAGQTASRSFIVNVRRPRYASGSVKLKARESADEAWAWDEKLTLEFNGSHPSVGAIAIEPADVPTVFLLGDSTVCDQPHEPYASWGQMLPRFFKPEVAVANHSESGETAVGSSYAHRFDKVLASMKRGDYLLMQFGHNDMKSKSPDAVATYAATLKSWIGQVKAKGGTPILITPVNRYTFQDKTIINSLGDYPDAVRRLAKETGTTLIDLNAMSKSLYEALGPEKAILLFEHGQDLARFDHTHHSPYGAYELARCMIEGIRASELPLASSLSDDVRPFNPAHPDSIDSFSVPASPGPAGTKPLGD
jgi:lysophospholipase L1-like esterase